MSSFKEHKKIKPTSLPYKSINMTCIGVSIYLPDSLSFKTNSNKVLCIFVGETRLMSGEKDVINTNLLLEDDTDFTFADAVKRNRKLVDNLNVGSVISESDRSLHEQSSHDLIPQYGKYEISVFDASIVFLTSLNAFKSDVPVDEQELWDDYRILQKFDIRILLEASLLEKQSSLNVSSNHFSTRMVMSIGNINVTLPNSRFAHLINYYTKFMENQNKMNSTVEQFTNQAREVYHQFNLDTQEPLSKLIYLYNILIFLVNDTGGNLLFNANESLPSQDDDDDGDSDIEFYDALDQEDKQTFKLIKNASIIQQNQDSNSINIKEETKYIDRELEVKMNQSQNNSLFMLWNIKAIIFNIFEKSDPDASESADKSKDNIYSQSESIFKVKLSMIDIGQVKTNDNSSSCFILHNFDVRHLGISIMHAIVIENRDDSDESNYRSEGIYNPEFKESQSDNPIHKQ